jgi:hypothetical protein
MRVMYGALSSHRLRNTNLANTKFKKLMVKGTLSRKRI